MQRFQFSILGLIGLMAFAGVGCAAMVNASSAWCSAVAVILMLALLNSIVGAIFRHGKQRVYWVGFLVFGWGTLLMLFGGSLVTIQIAEPAPYPNNVFISRHLRKLYDATHPLPPGYQLNPVNFGYIFYGSPNGGGVNFSPPSSSFSSAPTNPSNSTSAVTSFDPYGGANFVVTGNLLFVMLAALLGGFFARSFYVAAANNEKCSASEK